MIRPLAPTLKDIHSRGCMDCEGSEPCRICTKARRELRALLSVARLLPEFCQNLEETADTHDGQGFHQAAVWERELAAKGRRALDKLSRLSTPAGPRGRRS